MKYENSRKRVFRLALEKDLSSEVSCLVGWVQSGETTQAIAIPSETAMDIFKTINIMLNKYRKK